MHPQILPLATPRAGIGSPSSTMASVAEPMGSLQPENGVDDGKMVAFQRPRSEGDEFPSPVKSPIKESESQSDEDAEVAKLSEKLISAINHQTRLDDALVTTRLQLEATQEKALLLEAENKEHTMMVMNGDLVEKSEVDLLRTQLADEKKKRQVAEKDKKSIEAELETLSAALFEEANQMVANARRETEASEKRNEQLKQQIRDTEVLLASHQEQLAQLKSVMAEMRDEEDEKAASTAPSTPALSAHHGKSKSRDLVDSLTFDDSNPAPPTTFTHLLSPVLRTDLQVFEDFKSLIEISKKSGPASRVNSGSYGGYQPSISSGQTPNGSQISLTTPSNTSQPPSIQSQNVQSMASPLIPLKETKFYKRALTEDIEPTLRLDTAPGLSWMTRRGVVTSMCEGTFVVEPMPYSTKMSVFSCALCGENRKSAEFARTHRFRTNESDTAQRYPLCAYCLNRVRSCCDYLGFLRMVKDGHFRVDGVEGEKAAWEESVRLRERMFWARIGGGVVPASGGHDSPRSTTSENRPHLLSGAASHMHGNASPPRRLSIGVDTPPLPDLSRLSVDKAISARSQPKQPKNLDVRDDWESTKSSGMFDANAPPGSAGKLGPSVAITPSQSSESLNRSSLRESLRMKPRSRASSYEIERLASDSDSRPDRSYKPSQAPAPFLKEDSGLQISMPGGFV